MRARVGLKYSACGTASIGVFVGLLCLCQTAFAAELDDLYDPLLPTFNVLYTGEYEHFRLNERGNHGGSSFDRYDSNPDIRTLSNSLKFAPASFLEIELLYNEMLPEHYKRSTYDTTSNLSAVNNYRLDHFRDFGVYLRGRGGPLEVYGGGFVRHQKTSWDYATPGNAPIIYNYIESHYENFNGGVRFLSEHRSGDEKKSELSRITSRLLSSRQFNLELELDYKNGKIRRNNPYYAPVRYYNIYQTLNPHFTPAIKIRYGLRDDLQIESGLSFITPYKFKYDYRRYNLAGTTLMFPATYELSDQFAVPLRLEYRPIEHLAIRCSSDLKMGKQTLNFYQKNLDDSVTNYPTRELVYFMMQPSVRLLYLMGPDGTGKSDIFSEVTKDLLARNQLLLELFFKKDITHLDKRDHNNAQNVIDPYDVFRDPLESFVAGSEYSLFSAGNYTNIAAGIQLQNYVVLEGGATYGIFDNVNMSAKVGYHSGSRFHHFVVNEIQDRHYVVKPYYYFDLGMDWRVIGNSMISVRSHLVPEYKTFMTRSGDSKSFYQKTMYFDIAVMWRILFG